MTLQQELAAALADIRLVSTPGYPRGKGRPLSEVQDLFEVPGVGVAIVDNRELAFVGSGVRRAGDGEVEVGTLFQAGSISKPVAALCALRLVADGAIGLDDEANDHLRTWRIPANDDWQPRVTIRNLLSHTAGLTVHGFPGYPRDGETPSLAAILDGAASANTPPVRVASLPDLQFSYSGGGYCVLQQLLIDLTGQEFAALADEKVLRPLGMSDSTYAQPLPDRAWGRAASGHRAAGKPVAGDWHVYPEQAAAGLWTTPLDLVRFIIGVQDARLDRSSAIISSQLAVEMLTPQATNVQYGLGLYLAGSEPYRRFGHGGDDQGFQASMLAYEQQGAGVVAMTNSDNGGLLLRPVMAAVIRHFGWPEHPEREAAIIELEEQVFAASAGTFVDGEGGSYTVRSSGSELFLTVGRQDPIRFVATTRDVWIAPSLNVRLTFTRDKEGVARELSLAQDAQYTTPITAELRDQ